MGILKTLTLSYKRETNGNYRILLQKNPPANQPCLLFEANTVICLEPDEADKERRTSGYTKILDGYACLGDLQYVVGSKEIHYLIVVIGCQSVGKIQNSEVFRITETAFLSMRNRRDDHQHIQGVKRLLESGSYYFARSNVPDKEAYDLTLPSQRAYMTDVTDNRFFWNRLLFRQLERFKIDTSIWLVKAVCGGITISTVYIGGLQARACLISRLSCERAGTRFNVRGVNDLGHVANFVETEQVIFVNQTVLSFIIIRGSIPLFWEQPGLQVGSHRIKMSRGSEISQAAYDKHMFLLKERFDNVVLVNLLSSLESELLLNQSFNAHHRASQIGSEFPFINFDYRALCRGVSKEQASENLSRLYSYELKKYIEQFGYFHSEKGEVVQLQKGVFRVNCLDCLDRTNSLQKFIGLSMIPIIVGCLDRVDTEKLSRRLYDIYEPLWKQSGDQISMIYAGTGALEGRNIIRDGTLSVVRTIQSNLLDADKQGAIDILILGRTLNLDYSYRAASLLPHYFMYASPNILVSMCDRYLEYCVPENAKIVVATWNVNGGRHFDNTVYNRARPLSDWLVDYRTSIESRQGEGTLLDQSNASEKPVDIYAIGFQEIVDLNAGNIVASSTQNQRDWLFEIQKTISKNHQYLLVTSVQLVGVCLFVFIRSELAPYIKDVCNDQVKTGLGGATGNKGAVAVRLRYKATSLCFVCAHFAAGQHQVNERNDDYAEITRKIQFPMGRSVNSHDYVFWCGDFNYRLDDGMITNDEVRYAAAQGNYSRLLQCDQLKISQADNRTFIGYIEGKIDFAPTYKYDTNSNDYDSSEKCRIPAYTDRILFKKRHETHAGEELTDSNMIKFYNRVELLSSDHRPVVAEFDIETLDTDKYSRKQVLDRVLDDCGPPDSTVFVKVDGHLDVADEKVFEAILKILSDEAGDIVLVRYVNHCLMVIFNDGKTAKKAKMLDGSRLGPDLPDNKLIISLKTANWHDELQKELINNMDNTINLISGVGPKVHLEDDEDEVAQELNMSLGPEINPDVICLSNDLFLAQDQAEASASNLPVRPPAPVSSRKIDKCLRPVTENAKGASEPRSPLHLPSRPPPPPPAPLRGPSVISELKDPTIATRQTYSNVAEPDRFDAFAQESAQNEQDVTFGDSTFDQASVNLLDLSINSDFDDSQGLPPPTMAPPDPPDLTPSQMPPSIPAQPPMGKFARPSRDAPPPPIPSRTPPNKERESRSAQI